MAQKIIMILMLMLIVLPLVAAKHDAEATTEGQWTVIVGEYIPDNGTIPVGEKVDIVCRHGNETNSISQGITRLTAEGLYGTSVPNNKCTVNDTVRACIDNPNLNITECSGWIRVGLVLYEDDLINVSYMPRNYPKDYINFGVSSIIGVPEYTTLGAGFLVLLTGLSIAYLRRNKY